MQEPLLYIVGVVPHEEVDPGVLLRMQRSKTLFGVPMFCLLALTLFLPVFLLLKRLWFWLEKDTQRMMALFGSADNNRW